MTTNVVESIATGTVPSPTAALPPNVPPPAMRRASGGDPGPRRWSRDEYYEMSRNGWFRGKRVMLLDGEIIEMAGQGNWHSVVLELAAQPLRKIFPDETHWVRTQRPLDLPDGSSDPEPDIAVVPGRAAEFTAHPSTALLIVEVADSSLRLDRKKANAYAAAGVPDYWIVDIGGHQIEVYREPVADPREPFGFRYASALTLRPGASISPVAAPHATVAVADLLPKQPVPNPDA